MDYATPSPQELWQPLETALSFLSALEGTDNPVLWLERPAGEKTYMLMAKVGSTTKPLEQWLSGVSGSFTAHWLKNQGVRVGALDEYASSIVEASLERSTWEVSRDPENKVIRSMSRRLPPLLWSYNDDLRHEYWKLVCSSVVEGRHQDRWAKQLRELLAAPYSDEGQNRAFSLIRPILERRPDWEYQTHQSWRAWAWNDDRWQQAMDNWGVSTRHHQDGVALPLWAIEHNWSAGLSAWMNEVGVSSHFVPRHEDIPSHWRADGNDLTGSLWHWSARLADAAFVSTLISRDSTVLDSLDVAGRTALHWACLNGNVGVVAELIKSGANPCIEDEDKHVASELLGEQFDELFDQMEEYRLSWVKSHRLDP